MAKGWAWMAHETKRGFQYHVHSLSCVQVLDTAACLLSMKGQEFHSGWRVPAVAMLLETS